MSYAPQLLVSRKDLLKVQSEINAEFFNLFGKVGHVAKPSSKRQEKMVLRYKAITFIRGLFEYHPVVFKEESIVLCRPEFTLFNEAVRKLMNGPVLKVGKQARLKILWSAMALPVRGRPGLRKKIGKLAEPG